MAEKAGISGRKTSRLRKPEAIAAYQEQLSAEIDFYEFLQYLFAGQWAGLKTYANEQGIEIIGDIPIYVALTVQIPGRIEAVPVR